jgi:hypothetical protein
MTRVTRKLTLISLSVLLGACASAPPEPKSVSEEALDAQEAMFDALYVGQPLSISLSLIGDSGFRFFDVIEEDVVYQYIEARNAETGAGFALFFKSGKLTTLVVEADVAAFHSCRATSEFGHWLWIGFAPYVDWLGDHNVLGRDFDKRAHHVAPPVSGGMDVGDAIEAATYAPIIAVALGVYAADRITGGVQRDAKKERERAYRERVAPSLQIGDSFDKLIDLMGSYDSRDRVGVAEAYTYSEPSYTYGFVNDKLVWKESPSMFGNTRYPALSCPDKTLWSPPE